MPLQKAGAQTALKRRQYDMCTAVLELQDVHVKKHESCVPLSVPSVAVLADKMFLRDPAMMSSDRSVVFV